MKSGFSLVPIGSKRFCYGASIYRFMAYFLIFPVLSLLPACLEPIHSMGSDDILIPISLNFPRKSSDNFMTARELSIWARNRNLVLLRDCPQESLQNDNAEVIGPDGLAFTLAAPGNSRVFLYLDFVTFRPLTGFDPRANTAQCIPDRDMVHYGSVAGSGLLKVHWLEIIVNGTVLKTLHQGGGAFINSPVEVTIHREHARERLLKIRLLPSPGDGFFAIWDVFVRPDRIARHPDQG